MPVTLIVEPNPGGHRLQAVANVAALAGRTNEIVLLTSEGAPNGPEFANFLADLPIAVDECFDGPHPPARAYVQAVVEHCRSADVREVLLMDADHLIKRWWYLAARAFRGVPARPRVLLMLTRYPARLRPLDYRGWILRTAKATLLLLGMLTRTIHHVAGFAGREDLARGRLVKRARDPAICSAHSRDRRKLRELHGLPADRPIVGIFGGMSMRKNPPLVLDAIAASGVEAVLLLAGKLYPDCAEWLARLPAERRTRIIVRDGFLTDPHLDQLVAASDVTALAMTLNGPSGIMGKAHAAGVPVVTAGSVVRARELRGTGCGLAADLTPDSFGAALRRVLTAAWTMQADGTPPATGAAFAAALLGVPAPVTDVTAPGRSPR